MWNFQRIICIWICCVSCMFGTTQLSSLVQAVPYEYFDDHEQSFYDLDTEQIQAKYDTRLLSQQMLQTEQQQQRQQQQQQQHLENLKGFHNTDSEGQIETNRNNLEKRKHNDAGGPTYISSTTTKLKSNDGYTLNDDNKDVNNEHNDWLEETVPRLDNCEVCLCMDGEIFCWWEKCDKKSNKATTTYDDYSTPFEESSTTRMQLNPKTTYKTTLKPMKKPKTNEDYKYDDDDSAEIFEMQQEYEGLKEQLMRKEHEQEQHKIHHNKQMVKKKIYQQQEEEKHNKKIKEQNKKKQEEQQRHKQQQQKQKQHKNNEQHHHTHNHNNNNNRNNNHDYSSSGTSSKILNFPENLPSVLYYDYKTEEHHQHQHQHHEQHLKHQKQKQQQLLLQQHEKELKHREQQQQQHQQQQVQHHVNRHHEYGQDFNTYNSNTDKKLIATAGSGGGRGGGREREGEIAAEIYERKLHDSIGGPSTTFKYFSNGNENIYNGDLQTDSDILPEPPTKKPKFSTSITDTTATAKTTGIPISQLYRLSTSTTAGGITKSTITTTSSTTTVTKALTNTPPTASIPLKKQIFSPWDYNKPNRDKINNNRDNGNNDNNNNKESAEDIIDTDDQDDAFHRWLTSTEKNNKNNFTLNDSIIDRDDGGLDASNINDYNMEDRNYENIDLETEAGLPTLITKTKTTLKPITTMGEGTTTVGVNAFDMTRGEREMEGVGEEGAGAVIYADGVSTLYGNSQKPKYEQNFNDNNNDNMANSNGNNYKNNILPFSHNSYQDYNNGNSNNNMDSPTSSSSSGNVINSTTSNEDNGVASVVNIDIMLTASSADSQQLQQQLTPQQTNIETTNQHRQLQDFEYEKQISKAQLKFVQPPPVLISNTNVVDNKNPLYSIINDNNKSYTSNSNNNKTVAYIVGDGLNIELQNVGVNLSSGNNNNNNSSNSNNNSAISLSSSGDSLKFNHISTVVSQTNATLATTAAGASAKTPPPLSTTLSPERQCNVMGTLYKIGDVLPQDTGNCLQCICIDGSTSDDTPRVTCSPHNCPPLVLPDLFDATGY